MPIKWTAELDSILLHGVFEECNISFSKPLCAKIAERVAAAGLECTPKAVENHLYSWKKKNVSGNTGLNAASSTPAKSATASKAPKTPSSRSKMVPKKKKSIVSSDESPDDTLSPKSPSAGRGKRARKASYAESDGEEDVELDYVPMGKRIKAEPKDDDDDEGFGVGNEYGEREGLEV